MARDEPPAASRAAHASTSTRADAALMAFARGDAAAALSGMDSGAQGLSDQVAAQRLVQYGPNAATGAVPESVARQLLRRLANPLNLLLIALAALSLVSGNRESGFLIALMVVASVTLAFVQERRSNRAAAQLKAMVRTNATVLRGGVSRELPIEQLVPGDVIHLGVGDIVPADVRVMSAKDLFVNQSSMTGEAMPVEKTAAAAPAQAQAQAQAQALDLPNVCFMGTDVTSGTATALVVNTGANAVFGGIAAALGAGATVTDFDRGMSRFTWLMIRFIGVMVPLVFVINGLTKGDWIEALLFATAVGVGLTPEMLPMLVTVNLAKGAIAMSRRKVIVKHMDAIQNFGAMDILCTDKTGTLTQNTVILERYEDLDGQPSDKVLDYAYLNSFYQSGLKNLLDEAVLRYADVHARVHSEGAFRKIDEIPFDFVRRRMSVVLDGQDGRLLICKGAVEEVFSVCRSGVSGAGEFALDASHLQALQAQTLRLNEDGFRVLAIACKHLPADAGAATTLDESELTLLGYVAFLDPPKETAQAALVALASHGLGVKILTGDNAVVTRRICSQVGLGVDRIVLGQELDALDLDAVAALAEAHQVFAKLSPAQKARVIDALRSRGHVVGYLGDGINDAPALKAADVGISVDTAVDIAKESADIILLDKNLMVLDDGVVEGRRVFANLLKYIRMGASSNFGNTFSVLGASAWLPFLPMAPIQILVNNLLYDLSQTAIATDNVDAQILQRPRRWDMRSIARFMLVLGPISSIFDYATFCLMFFWFRADSPDRAALFQTGWLVESLLSQTLVVHVIRTSRVPWLQSRASKALTLTSGAICSVAIALPYLPFASGIGLVPLPLIFWPMIAALLALYLGLAQVAKRWCYRATDAA
jgi:Mg2+-importing ATPase